MSNAGISQRWVTLFWVGFFVYLFKCDDKVDLTEFYFSLFDSHVFVL